MVPAAYLGLQYLETVDQLIVHQGVEFLELLTGVETENRYTILNSNLQNVFYAEEQSSYCARRCYGNNRNFEMKILDVYQNEAIHLSRPHVCCNYFCCPCCRQSIKVYAPPGAFVGSVKEMCSLIRPSFSIKNEFGRTELKIIGPFCTNRLCRDVKFHVYSKDGHDVGMISKTWSGMVREMSSNADNFTISFPADLDVKLKAVLLAALFLIDYMFYEAPPKKQRRR